ncbi:3-deoxy-manno-octulosonate cytidylyltransferase [Polymorphobacter multimanifer]|uniref:3-deoxy-manno-octulosonate cytidylyltransferase (CMP-KDO synthetase) n=1 Tax=Polymorphobacter multimanifer TaxID=1070431 RepID=A0A841L794_9SPHN|nr:3-deoxy-manno-octulosonate cytidylyltransferase [Polymorphobacter multimanifer]MBB6228300.1 3-deoxy-manno-octulosonate cytidylyltransferase (CMP-KDO synthetase) [Polymorphobacter multimanifer]GGI86190.1 3-deoxy-manno-octulosonate cytidylyltransferase [Polymorphobacter multimanifer]
MPRIAIIIPARFASTRYPGKPLVDLAGPEGRTMALIDWTWAAATAVPGIAEVAVATEDERIADHARARGMAVIMTPAHCSNGTERCAAALQGLAAVPDIVVNLQGDAPLIPPAMVRAVIDMVAADPDLAMATAAVPASPAVLGHLQEDARHGRVGGTTVVCTAQGRALYFSKSIIPHVPAGTEPAAPVLLHVGLYAYRPAALAAYVAAGASPLERQEGLEQLRFLEAGIAPGVAICPAPAWDLIELNNPSDRPLVEAQLRRRAQQAVPA